MYEILLKWGIDNLVGLATARDRRDIDVLIEAIRAKNSLVLERFRYASAASQSIVDVAIEVDESLEEFRAKRRPKNQKQGGRETLAALRGEFHARHYRRLKKARSRFESTNDLLSSYSATLLTIVHIDTLEKIVKHKKLQSVTDVLFTYRGLWTLYAELMSSLVRVASADLRFWLTDEPYVTIADQLALIELQVALTYLLSEDWGRKRFHLSLETPKGLEAFWLAVTTQITA